MIAGAEVGVADTNVDDVEVAAMITDFGTRSEELYAPADEVLQAQQTAGVAAGDRPSGGEGEDLFGSLARAV